VKNFFEKSLIIIITFLLIFPVLTGCQSAEKPLSLIIVWHNHQPFYEDPTSNSYILPWVRLHAVKDYYRMPYLLSNYKDVKATFDLSGSLISQISDYMGGAEDKNEILSKKPISNLTVDEKLQILAIPGGFFDLNWDHILKKVPMYEAILNKRNDAFKNFGIPLDKEKIVNYLSKEDYINLIALFNLFWMDPEYIKSNNVLNPLLEKAYAGNNFTEDEIKIILSEQLKIIPKVFQIYKELLDKNQIELVTTPYSHPISPLLTDFGWTDDLKLQIDTANEIFNNVFQNKPGGAWASECALNDDTLKIFSEKGWLWTISDTDNLKDIGIDTKTDNLSKYIPYNIDGVTVFFRDKYLSDGISFRYSGKTVEDAVNDVKNTLLDLQKDNKNEKLVYTIALDGENAWEYYQNDGNDFLNAFYGLISDLEKQNKVRTITPSEYIKKFGPGETIKSHSVKTLNLENADISNVKSYSGLPTQEINGYFGESSWVNPTLDTWIGEPQENIAWAWLKDARSLYLYKKNSVGEDAQKKALEALLRAEGSDWFWWYGSDQSSGNDMSFDRLFKIYISNIYNYLGENMPQYLYGNFFPDGAPYISEQVALTEGKTETLPMKDEKIKSSISLKGNELKIGLQNTPKKILIGIYNGKSLNSFFKEQKVPQKFSMSPFPFDISSVGMPIDTEISETSSAYPLQISISTEKLNKNNLFIAFATLDNEKNLTPLSNPIQIKLPIKIEGETIGELFDDEGDDNGPGSYVYPLNEIFKNSGNRLFDLVSFTMIDSGDVYVMQYKMGNLGGNPWNGPTGISFQIIETYIDFKDGGLTDAIDTNGPKVAFSEDHKWDIAIRTAGWSYGNYVKLSDGSVVQGELQIQADSSNNIITITIPKKYMEISQSYKPYIAIISGSQDGYGPGYWRTVGITPSEWGGGGADTDAFNSGISSNIYDIFVPEGLTQNKILTGYDITNKTLASIPYLPLEKAKAVPKLTGIIDLQGNTTPGSEFSLTISVKNIGKGNQPDNPGSEISVSIPDYLRIKTLKADSGKVSFENNTINWNGTIATSQEINITSTFELDKNVPNATNLDFKGTLLYDEKASKENTAKTEFEKNFTVKYPVYLEINADSNVFKRNGITTPVDTSGKLKIEYKEDWDDLVGPVENIVKALGGIYNFDAEKNKMTIVFMGNTYEHWIGQNKSLINGSAIPLFPNKPDIKSYIQDKIPFLPLKSIAYGLKLSYTFNGEKKSANLNYLP
jgi:alpha-amylase/alpha-mannosidase (GH57 family)